MVTLSCGIGLFSGVSHEQETRSPSKITRKEGLSPKVQRESERRKKTEQAPRLHPSKVHGSACDSPIQISPTKHSHAGAGRSSSVFWLPSSRAIRHFRSAAKIHLCLLCSRLCYLPGLLSCGHTAPYKRSPPPHTPYLYHHNSSTISHYTSDSFSIIVIIYPLDPMSATKPLI